MPVRIGYRKIAFALLSLLWLTSMAPLGRGPAPARGLAAASVAGQRAGLALPPLVEPVRIASVGRDQARLINASVPFSQSFGPVARPFFFTGDLASRDRAIDCLASAMWYEAGNDPVGQRAVGQVVLNRARHPAFPASVCGVVFQGSERRTGCQFTFTCDGALQRIPSERSFAAARVEATAMLDGVTDPEVGLATHYHTDWVSPIWSAQMDKIARVGTHLFFRWRGRWGSGDVMAPRTGGTEPAIPALARISRVHGIASSEGLPPAAGPDGAALAQAAEAVPPAPLSASPLAAPAPLAGTFELRLAAGGNGADSAMNALRLCGAEVFCRVVGRMGDDAGRIGFVYVRDRRTGVDQAYWDCDVYHRNNPAQCLSEGTRAWAWFDGNRSHPPR